MKEEEEEVQKRRSLSSKRMSIGGVMAERTNNVAVKPTQDEPVVQLKAVKTVNIHLCKDSNQPSITQRTVKQFIHNKSFYLAL